MNKTPAKKAASVSKTITLTKREQQIYDILLKGSSLKEISYELKIQYDTVYFHQKNIFKKLNVKSHNEFFVKHLQKQPGINYTDIGEVNPVLFMRLFSYYDNHGSFLEAAINEEQINEQNFTCYKINGTLSSYLDAYAGVSFYPYPETQEIIKKASSFSFYILGDGNAYDVQLPTSETATEGGQNHYRLNFPTQKNKISMISVNMSELVQSKLFGKKVPFIQKNIDHIIIQPFCTGKFNIKVWDFKFYL